MRTARTSTVFTAPLALIFISAAGFITSSFIARELVTSAKPVHACEATVLQSGHLFQADTVVWAIDASSSLAWGIPAPIQVVKESIHDGLNTLAPSAHFSLVRSSGTSLPFSPTPLPATPQNIANAMAWVNAVTPNSSVCLDTLAIAALEIAHAGPGRAVVLCLGDGVTGCAPFAPAIEAANPDSVAVHCFQVGSFSSNDFFEQIAVATGGVYVIDSAPSDPVFRRGDVNSDSHINVTDVVALLTYLIFGAPVPCCPQAADINGSDTLALNDALILLSYLFQMGPPPVAPGPSCGSAPPSALGLCAIGACP